MTTIEILHEMMKPGASPTVLLFPPAGRPKIEDELRFRIDDETGEHVFSVGGYEFREDDVSRVDPDGDLIILRRTGIVKLIRDARAAGLLVEGEQDPIRIRRGPRSAGIDVWSDGSALRCDVELDQALQIRTIQGMREILGLA